MIINLTGGPCNGATVTGVAEGTKSVVFTVEIAKGVHREADAHRYLRTDKTVGDIVFFELERPAPRMQVCDACAHGECHDCTSSKAKPCGCSIRTGGM